MKKFDIPEKYISSIISEIKRKRKLADPKKREYTPTLLDFGPIRFLIARHFGFCYGVENAIEIAYNSIEKNPDKKVFLLSEMIHNPSVNVDLKEKGVNFLMNTDGTKLGSWENLSSDDIVIIPAFGTTIEIEHELKQKGIDPYVYDTTCPFVEKVWNRAASLGNQNYTVIIHGKHDHEETRATFSHSKHTSKSIIIRDLEEAKILGDFILGNIEETQINNVFKDKFSEGFDFQKDLDRIGVVNQTTMLASETEKISDYLKAVMIKKFGADEKKNHFADTRDTLCYATNDNQKSTKNLIETDSDFAIVIGGYNSSNTTHLVELLSQKFQTFFISSEKMLTPTSIKHFDINLNKEILSEFNFLNGKTNTIAITSGASCPDTIVDDVIEKIISFYPNTKNISQVISQL